jgi:preprotein translocase subunit SecF
MNIIGRRYLYFAISLLVIIPGLISLMIWGLPLGIDFSGGSMLEVKFDTGKTPQPAQIISLYNEFSTAQNVIRDPQVQTSGVDTLVIRSKQMDEATKAKIEAEMSTRFGSKITEQRFDSVGPTIGAEVTVRGAEAVGLAALGILLFITFAFRKVPYAYRFGAAAIIAMLHDVAVVVGMAAMLGHFLGWEADSLFLTALLTVIGFSVHDTIVVFDRIRENSTIHPRLGFEKVVNHSVVQTLDRSINTQLTVMLTLFSLALFGGVTIRHFVVTLLIGVFSGTYSSIFNASPILVVWENREWRYWFKGNWKKPSAVTSD